MLTALETEAGKSLVGMNDLNSSQSDRSLGQPLMDGEAHVSFARVFKEN
jgi:hypothetical protein